MRKKQKHPCEQAESVASGMECTGLMPAYSEDDEEDERIRELYAVQPAKRRDK